MFQPLGKALLIVGGVLVLFGLLFFFWDRIPLIGKLPGDISIQKGGFRFFFPIVTSIVLSLALTVVVNVILWLIRR